MTSTYLLLRRAPALGLSLLFALIASQCAAATLYVSPTGSDDNSGTVAAPYKTIQAAVNNASDSDVVTLMDGTYSGIGNRDIDLKGKNITIKSEHGASKTIINCEGTQQDQHRAFYLHSKEATTLSSLTMENGCKYSGGAINVDAGSSIKMIGCILTNNVSSGVFNRGTADMINCTFTKNSANSLGDVSFGGAIYSDGILTLTHCTFAENSEIGFDAGAVYNSGKASVTSCKFVDNKADRSGGAIYSRDTMKVTDTMFSGNAAQHGSGGAIFCTNSMTLTNCFLAKNSAETGGGGAIFSAQTLRLNACTFSNNTARYGGAISNEYTGEDIIYLNSCSILSNTAVKGGGIWVGAGAQLTNCIVFGNVAHTGNLNDNSGDINTAEGGGLFNHSGTPQFKVILRSCSLSGNIAQGPTGQGGAIENDGKAVLTDVILWGNTASNESEIGLTTVGNPTTTVTYCDIQGGLSGTGNIKVNPLFVSKTIPIMPPLAVTNVGDADLHLQAGSPCRSAGVTIPPVKADPTHDIEADPGVSTDADEMTRPDPPSIGAYEYSANPPKPKKVLLTLDNPTAPDAAPVGSATTETAPTPDPVTANPPPIANQPVAEAAPAALPNAAPQAHVKLWPAEQKQENAAFLQLMVTLNTNHFSPSDMAQKVQAELDKGADINAKDSEGFPAIVTTASLAHTDVVQVLLDHGADKNAVTDPASKSSVADSASILHKTAAGGYQVDIGSAIAGLFAKKPKPLSGQTALMFAALTGQTDMVTLLLTHGADAQMKDSRGKTAQDYAGQGNHPEIGEMLKGR